MKRKKRPLLAGALVLILSVALTAAVLAAALDTSGGNFSTGNSRSGLTAVCTYKHTQILGENGTGSAKFTGEDVIQLAAASYYQKNIIITTTDQVTVTLTLTNGASYPQTLSFTLAASLDSDAAYTVTANGESKKNTPGNHSYELAAGGTCLITLKSPTASADTTGKNNTVTISGIKLASDSAQVTFYPAENGSYSVGGTPIESGRTIAYTEDTSIVLTPQSGYEFAYWMSCDESGNANGVIYSEAQKFAPSGAVSVKPIFKRTGSALYQVTGLAYYYLDKAIAAAGSSGTIIVTGSGTVYHSDGVTTDFEIPANVTLLVPRDGTYPVCGDEPEDYVNYDNKSAPSVYRTLTMASGTNITVKGTIEVSGGMYAAEGGDINHIAGGVGLIKMAGGSTITVDGGTLRAWGFIARNGKNDEGSITVTNNGTVYEFLQMAFCGGTAASSYTENNKVFPVSQYFVQNVEVPMTIHAGATEKLYTGVYATKINWRNTVSFAASSGAMFNLASGTTFTKDYKEETDRMEFSVNGSATLDSLTVKISFLTIESSAYVLPLTNNVTVNVLSGNLTITNEAALLPGVEAYVAQGATVTVNNNLYVYDVEQWGKYTVFYGDTTHTDGGFAMYKRFWQLPYVSTGKPVTRIIVDAKIDVNGTLNVTGNLYTTASGANICTSKGTGKVILAAAPESGKTYQGVHGDTSEGKNDSSNVRIYEIPITSAKLKNGADRDTALYASDYTETAGAPGTYTYCTECQVWARDGHAHAITITWTPLSYTFTPEYTWDPAALRYTVTSGTWAAAEGGGTVTLESNYPTAHVATFAFTPSVKDWTPAMTFTGGDTVTLNGVAYSNPVSTTVTATLSGVPPAFTGEVSVGSVTITIRKKQ